MSTREYRFQGRKADGTPCCNGNDLSALCDSCRHAADNAAVPAARRLSDALNKSGHLKPTPREDNDHGVPKPARLADAMAARGDRR